MAELRFLYQPVADLAAAAQFYTETLGFQRAWSDGDVSIGLRLPGGGPQVMLSTSGKAAGPMYLVESLDRWVAEHSSVKATTERDTAGTGHVLGFEDPDGNVFYIFDQNQSSTGIGSE